MSDKPASRYEAKQSQAVESNHANHRPPVAWCKRCQAGVRSSGSGKRM